MVRSVAVLEAKEALIDLRLHLLETNEGALRKLFPYIKKIETELYGWDGTRE